MTFTFYKQLNAMDCGATCLRMVAKYHGRHYNGNTLRNNTGYNKRGVSLLGISEAAEKIGLRTRGVQIDFERLKGAPMPAVIHWNHNHFVVLINASKKKIKVADPAKGIVQYNKEEFLQNWISNNANDVELVGTVLLMEPTTAFFDLEGEGETRLTLRAISQYLKPKKWQITQVFLSLIVGMLIQLIIPFLTQSMVDVGINTSNLPYITIILCAQLMFTFSNTIVGFIRSRLQLRISNGINISILSDFWIKLTQLPLSYFDSHHTGDTIQRIRDNKQIQSFLTGQAINTTFSVFNLVVYAVVLISYSLPVFTIFIIGNLLNYGWVKLFLPIRRKLNYQSFYVSAQENTATLELVQGMQEIRLNGAEQLKRWRWENIQAKIFQLNFKSLNYEQWQSAGALLISQGKDIFMTFVVAKMVIEGKLTFGAMLAVQYIAGQLSGPVQQFVGLAQNVQDTKISLERLNEIHDLEPEEHKNKSTVDMLPEEKSITVSKLSFTYPGAGNSPVISDINLNIPQGKVTAIVGVSGSGKTTLLKLFLKIYENYQGELKVGETNFKHLSASFWRKQCGAVLQDGYIFNDSIARNIAVGDEYIDHVRLIHSCKIANILPFIETLANGFNTMLGAEGVGISQGQRQRILIARAVYKDPHYLFFDEATNALDANNEKAIIENLDEFFEGRTVVVIAHRLSTVKNADNIVVINQGKIIEEGSHSFLIGRKGQYYELVKNQLELGN